MAAHGIPVLAQEMIIRRRKDRFITEIVPNVPPETHPRPPVAAATAASTMQQYHAAAPCSSTTQQQQGPHPFITPIATYASILSSSLN